MKTRTFRALARVAVAAGLLVAIGFVWTRAGLAQAPPTAAGIRVVGLETDAAPEPLGIDDGTPRFTWRLEASRSTVEQQSYRVVVATSSDAAAAGRGAGLVWDSGVVASADPAAVYAGPALASRTRYLWTVKVVATGMATAESDAAWFETAYLDASDWKGRWIAGPERATAPLSSEKATADDACCLQVDTTLAAPVAVGATNLKVSSIRGFTAGRRLTVGREPATVTGVGTPAARTTLHGAAHTGETNVKVASVSGFATGQPIAIGSDTATITAVGTGAAGAVLAAAAAPGDATIQVAPAGGGGRGGFGRGRGGPELAGFETGSTIEIEGESRTIAGIQPPQSGRGGRGGPGGGGARGRGGRGSGPAFAVTVSPALGAAHRVGVSVSTPGSGITLTPALRADAAAGAAVTTPGIGVTLAAALTAAHPAGTAIRGEEPPDFCRPPGARGSAGLGACREVRPVPMLRKAFEVDPVSRHGAVTAARVYAAGLAYDNMTINGDQSSDRRLDPGFTNYAKTVLYTTQDVTSLVRQAAVRPAENVIATELGSGQFDDETTSGDWGWETAEWRATPRLRLNLYIRYADGTEQRVSSDASWKVSTDGPTRYDSYYLGETYDARKAIPGWNRPGFDDASWRAVRVVDGPAGTLRAEREEPTRVVATWPAGIETRPRPGVFVYDTGQQRAGWATISVAGAPAGTPIQIFYSDKTAPDGTVSSSGYTPNGQIQTDYYIASGTGTPAAPETFTPQFSYKGFQYVQISAPSDPASTSGGTPQPLPPGVTVTVQAIHEVRADLRPTGVFHAANPLLDRIEQNTRAALAENYVGGIITDTPEYEKNGWTGDAELSAPTASLLFDTARQYAKSVQDMVDNQVPATGELTLLAPTNAGYGHVGQTFKNASDAGATPVWDAFWFVIPWEAYMRDGDRRGLEATYPLMQKYWMTGFRAGPTRTATRTPIR